MSLYEKGEGIVWYQKAVKYASLYKNDDKYYSQKDYSNYYSNYHSNHHSNYHSNHHSNYHPDNHSGHHSGNRSSHFSSRLINFTSELKKSLGQENGQAINSKYEFYIKLSSKLF